MSPYVPPHSYRVLGSILRWSVLHVSPCVRHLLLWFLLPLEHVGPLNVNVCVYCTVLPSKIKRNEWHYSTLVYEYHRTFVTLTTLLFLYRFFFLSVLFLLSLFLLQSYLLFFFLSLLLSPFLTRTLYLLLFSFALCLFVCLLRSPFLLEYLSISLRISQYLSISF